MKWIAIVIVGYIAVICLGMFFMMGKTPPPPKSKSKIEIKEGINDVEKYGKMRKGTDQ